MGKRRLYHGTVTGKEDIFLESFIVTGAVSKAPMHSLDPWDQEPGFYACLDQPGAALEFSHTLDREEAIEALLNAAQTAEEKDAAKNTLRYGRGMIVEFEAEVDAENWDFDHEVSNIYSIALISKFKDRLSSLSFPTLKIGAEGYSLPKFYKNLSIEMDAEGEVCWATWENENKKQEKLKMPHWHHCEGNRLEAFLLEKVHRALKEKFLDEYQAAKQEVLDEMADGDAIKYVGTKALQVKKIYLCPAGFDPESKLQILYFEKHRFYTRANALAGWEIVYDRTKEEAEKTPNSKPKSGSASPLGMK